VKHRVKKRSISLYSEDMRMKFNVLGMVAVCGFLAVACKVETTDDNAGGNGGEGGSSDGGAGATTTVGGSGGTGGTPVACGDIGCDGSPDPTTNCIACTQDVGGDCEAEATACTEECGAIFDCINACPEDNPATMEVDEFLSCVCTLNAAGTQCEATSMAGTCFGDSPAGVAPFIDLNQCFIDTCTDPSCG
jgi:hypothetical protein